jgi:hypothetical protein
VSNDKMERLLNEIGQLLAEDTDYPLDNTLLYAELDWSYVAPSIFKDRGDHILYRDPDLDRLGSALLDLWNAQEAGKRWTEIEYIVRGGKFRASFGYPEDVAPGEEPLDRRERIATKHFGDKPIVYPPMPDDPDIMEYKP